MLCPHLVGTIDANLAKVLTNRLTELKKLLMTNYK
jgi:hypothetical protein